MRRIIVLVLLAFALTASTASAGENYTGVKLGMVSSGNVEFDGTTVDQNAGLAVGLFFDHPIGSRGHLGLTLDLLTMDWSHDSSPQLAQKEMLLDIGLCGKVRLTGEESDLIVRPGAGLGLGVLGKMETANLAASSYPTLKGSVEVAYDNGGDVIYLVETGLWYAPGGGDRERDVTIGPLLLLRAGVMF